MIVKYRYSHLIENLGRKGLPQSGVPSSGSLDSSGGSRLAASSGQAASQLAGLRRMDSARERTHRQLIDCIRY